VTECKGGRWIGRRPQGEAALTGAALTGAERQARYRLRLGLAADHAPGQIAKLPRAKPLSRRWHETVAGLVSLQAEYARWLDALPEATRDTATGEGPAGDGRSRPLRTSPPSSHPVVSDATRQR
jgi:hypothetical protein